MKKYKVLSLLLALLLVVGAIMSPEVVSAKRKKTERIKPTKITAKIITINTTKNYLKTAGYENKKISSYEELKAFITEARDNYVAAGYGTERQFYKSKFYKSLKKYSKGYFKTKVLYLFEGNAPTDAKHVKVRQLTKVQLKDGDLAAFLSVTFGKASSIVDTSANVYYQQFFVEVKKSAVTKVTDIDLTPSK